MNGNVSSVERRNHWGSGGRVSILYFFTRKIWKMSQELSKNKKIDWISWMEIKIASMAMLWWHAGWIRGHFCSHYPFLINFSSIFNCFIDMLTFSWFQISEIRKPIIWWEYLQLFDKIWQKKKLKIFGIRQTHKWNQFFFYLTAIDNYKYYVV